MAFFVNFKAAFDSVSSSVLWQAMEERRVDEGLIERIKETFVKTRFRVKIGNGKREEF